MSMSFRGYLPWIVVLALLCPALYLSALVCGGPEPRPGPPDDQQSYLDKSGDEELAYLLVKLVKRTRQIVATHYTRSQSVVPGVNLVHRRWMANNGILPAAVAGDIFSDVVPAATGGRAWVKMVRPDPRNPDNQGDSVSLDLLAELKSGASFVERSTSEAYYYGEPIKAKTGCLPCHGEPAGDPDPVFPQYKKEGWRNGDIIGGIISRVAPEE